MKLNPETFQAALTAAFTECQSRARGKQPPKDEIFPRLWARSPESENTHQACHNYAESPEAELPHTPCPLTAAIDGGFMLGFLTAQTIYSTQPKENDTAWLN